MSLIYFAHYSSHILIELQSFLVEITVEKVDRN